MNFSEEQVREIVEQRGRAIKKVEKYQSEIRTLENQIEIFDIILKQSSFSKASDLVESEEQFPNEQKPPFEERPGEQIPITYSGETIANAYVTPDEISVVLMDSISISEDIPPFKSYFVERILDGMPSKSNGGVSHQISKDGDRILEIKITNYREDRASEIVSTCGWTLNKMLEKTA